MSPQLARLSNEVPGAVPGFVGADLFLSCGQDNFPGQIWSPSLIVRRTGLWLEGSPCQMSRENTLAHFHIQHLSNGERHFLFHIRNWDCRCRCKTADGRPIREWIDLVPGRNKGVVVVVRHRDLDYIQEIARLDMTVRNRTD